MKSNISGKEICEAGKEAVPVYAAVGTFVGYGANLNAAREAYSTYTDVKDILKDVDCDKVGQALDAYNEVDTIGQDQEWGYDN